MDDNVSRVDKDQKVSPFNVPNALTVLRLILVPVFIFEMYVGTTPERWVALLLFLIASLTDYFDGRIARAQGIITDFGRIVDPIADKALTLSAFVMLSLEAPRLWFATIPIAIRELGITWWRAVLLKKGIVVSANKGGKLKTVLQIAAITLLLVPWYAIGVTSPFAAKVANMGFLLGWMMAGLALAVTLWSGWVYVTEGRRLQRELAEEAESGLAADDAAAEALEAQAASAASTEGDSAARDASWDALISGTPEGQS